MRQPQANPSNRTPPPGGGRLQPVLMRPTPQLSFKTGGGGGSWGGGGVPAGGRGGGVFLPGVGGGVFLLGVRGGVWPGVMGVSRQG